MQCQPPGDTDAWDHVLRYRPDDARTALIERLSGAGLTPPDVHAVLADLGEELFAAARRGEPDWQKRFGGPLAVALLAAEVSAYAAHMTARASAVRSHMVSELLDDYSAVTVAARLGVSRQKVYDIARTTPLDRFAPHPGST